MRSTYNGVVLTVDLAAGEAKAAKLDEALVREWGGGLGVALALWNQEGSGAAAVLGTGPLTAGFAPASCAGVAIATSPRTGRPAAVPLTWLIAAELKQAGFDFVVLRGEAASPVRLWIHDELCNVLDAAPLWGKDVWQTVDAERNDHGDDSVQVLAIGPAGEQSSADARLSESYWGSKDAAGIGAAFGVKKVKSIAIRGMGSFELSEEAFAKAVEVIAGLRGSALGLGDIHSRLGIGYAAQSAMAPRLHRLTACHGCPIPCNAYLILDGDPRARKEPKSVEPGILVNNVMDARALETGRTLAELRQAMREGRDPNAGSARLPVDLSLQTLGITLGICPIFLHLAGRSLEEELASILGLTSFFEGISVDEMRSFARKGLEALSEAGG